MTAPGVITTTSVRSGPAAAVDAEEATFYVAGITERGPVGRPILVRSMAEYAETFGDRVAYATLYDTLRLYFEEGGGRAVVSRAVGPAAAAGLLALKDRQGTPADTLRVTATSPGPWSTRVSVAVEAGITPGTVTLAVYLDGVVVERWQDRATVRDLVLALAGSAYVRGTDLGSSGTGTAALPAVQVATPLSAGTDDRASVDAARMLGALPTGDTVSTSTGLTVPAGAGMVAVPGQPAGTIGPDLLRYAKRTNRVAVLALTPGATAADAMSAARTITATAMQDGTAEYGQLVWPSVLVPVDGTAATRTVGPEGFVAAARARAIESAGGPWRVGAGELSTARYATTTDVPLDGVDYTALDNARVSPLRLLQGGLRVYGQRSLHTDEQAWKLLKDRDVVNALQVACTREAEEFVFETIDGGGRLLSRLQAAMIGVLDPIASAGGLYPVGDDRGYSVDTSAAVNTPAALGRGELRAVIGVRPSPTATLVMLTIAKAAPTTAL